MCGRVGIQWGRSEGGELEGENKRGGGGESEGYSRLVKFLNSPEQPVQGELIKFLYSPAPPPPTVEALDLPRIHPVKVTRGLVCIKQPMHL